MVRTPIRPDLQSYNYAHFRPRHAIEEFTKSLRPSAVKPGDAVPDFRLPRADGRELRLAECRGGLLLLRFTSIT